MGIYVNFTEMLKAEYTFFEKKKSLIRGLFGLNLFLCMNLKPKLRK